ncbi:deoxyribonuclease-2-beta isoform X2 [Hyperolius riggenbachi]|uniref:deoxyribonuclease-2-beta isoform X2 n=1 Tax=Hyperolius riggenbachi TaxID=752182 RepID=UPI0035A38158
MSGVYVMWLAWLACLCAASVAAEDISCRNEAGEPVDWFVVYKLPKYRINESDGTGLEYLYLDSKSEKWQVSKFLANMTQSALGQALQQLYRLYKGNGTAYMLYNDAPPGVYNLTKHGHTKASQLLYYDPNVYNCSIPDSYQMDLQDLHTICQGKPFPFLKPTQLATLSSAGGEAFLNFAKSKYFVDDIITAWMAQLLKVDLLSETWQPDGTELPSNCSLYWHVYNIKRIALPLPSFYSRYDHSKWCVSNFYGDTWICIGDLNRYPGQIWRSGGFLCTQNTVMYNAFMKMVAYFTDCYQ